MTRSQRVRFKIAWWLEGCPFSRGHGWKTRPPWDYRLGMRIMP